MVCVEWSKSWSKFLELLYSKILKRKGNVNVNKFTVKSEDKEIKLTFLLRIVSNDKILILFH